MYEENTEWLKRLRAGDPTALTRIVDANMGLVKRIALRFRDRGTEFEDLVQIGTIGMIKAARSYDFSYGTAFSTYAVPLIIGEIRRHLRDDGLIRVSRTVKKQGMLLMRAKEEFVREHGREPRISELAALCDMTPEEAASAFEATGPVRSFDEPTGDDENMTLGNLLSDKENAIDALTDRIALGQAISCLPELQRQIVSLRYFRNLSQQQTGEILGITQVKVSREEKKIMQKLRCALLGEKSAT